MDDNSFLFTPALNEAFQGLNLDDQDILDALRAATKDAEVNAQALHNVAQAPLDAAYEARQEQLRKAFSEELNRTVARGDVLNRERLAEKYRKLGMGAPRPKAEQADTQELGVEVARLAALKVQSDREKAKNRAREAEQAEMYKAYSREMRAAAGNSHWQFTIRQAWIAKGLDLSQK